MNFRARVYRSIALVAAGTLLIIGVRVVQSRLSHADQLDTSSTAEYPITPYISFANNYQPVQNYGQESFYTVPFRADMETVPASTLVNGIGATWNAPDNYDIDAQVHLAADSGLKAIRVEEGWGTVSYDENGFVNQGYLDQLLLAFKKYGIKPTFLLNANEGVPTPNFNNKYTVVSGGNSGSKNVVLTSVDGLTPLYSGIDYNDPSRQSGYQIFSDPILSIDSATKTISLEHPLVSAIANNAQVPISTVKYLPFYPPGTPQFDVTMSGWLKYVGLLMDRAVADGIPSPDVEIWNEVGFGSDFLGADNYFTNSSIAMPYCYAKGGVCYEMVRQTGDYVHSHYSSNAINVINGFQNSCFMCGNYDDLDGVEANGQSAHLYSAAKFNVGASGFMNGTYGSVLTNMPAPHNYAPSDLNIALPESWYSVMDAHIEHFQWVAAPDQRIKNGQPYKEYMTEQGFLAPDVNISDPNAYHQYQAKAALRMYAFNLNKGVSQVDQFQFYDGNPLGWGMISTPVTASKSLDVQRTPELAAIKNMVGQFNGATAISYPPQTLLDTTALIDSVQIQGGSVSVPNGTFETPSVGSGSTAYQNDPSGSSWAYTSSSGISGNSSGLTSANPNAPEGSQVGYIQTDSTMQQVVSGFQSGTTYRLSFSTAKRANESAGNVPAETVQVYLDANLIGTVVPTSTQYTTYTTAGFTTTTGNHVLKFVGTGARSSLQPGTPSRQLDVDVTSIGNPQPIAFHGDGTTAHPDQMDRDRLAFLPFQVNDHTFVAGVYVVTYDATATMPTMTFRLKVKNVNGTNALVSWYDPLTGTYSPANVSARDGQSVTVQTGVTDAPQFLRIEEGARTTFQAPQITTTATGASLNWSTTNPGTSQVAYGSTSRYGQQTSLVGSATTSHTASISGLSSCTTYNYQLRTTDTDLNPEYTPDSTFTTAGCTVGAGTLLLTLPTGTARMYSGIDVKFFQAGTTTLVTDLPNLTSNANGGIVLQTGSLDDSVVYDLKISIPGFLIRKVSGATHVVSGQLTLTSSQTMVPGDFNGDNQVTLGDIVAGIGAYRKQPGAAAALATQTFAGTFGLNSLITVIHEYNINPHGD